MSPRKPPKTLRTFRLAQDTLRQVAEMVERLDMTQTEIIETAVGRLYRATMKPRTATHKPKEMK